MNPLALIFGMPAALRWGLMVAAVAAAAWVGHLIDIKAHERRAFAAGQAEVTARWDAAEKIRAETAAKAETEARAEEQRRTAAQLEIVHVHQLATDRARADAAAASDAAGRLRERIADLLASAGSGQAASDPASASGSTAAEALGDVLGQCVERYRAMAVEADAARDAGTTCERSYDALSPGDSTSTPEAVSR